MNSSAAREPRWSNASGAATTSVLLAATLFGTTGTALALGPNGMGAISAGILRLLIGGLGLIVVALLTNSPFKTLRPSQGVIFLGALAVAAYQLCFFYATTSTGVALATVVTIGSSPLAARGIGALRRRPSPGSWWAVSAGLLLVGLVLLVLGSGGEASFSLGGIATALIAGISYAAYTECGSMSLATGSSPTSTMAAMFFGGGILASPLLISQDLNWLGDPSGLFTIAYLSLVTLSLAYVWFGWGLKHLPPTSVVMLTMFEPVVAAVLAIVILDEELTLLAWIGIVVVLIGLSVVGRASRRTHAQPATVAT